MNKFILEMFGFIRSALHFCKIIVVFSILMLLMIWVQDLTGQSWGWTNFIEPFIDMFILAGATISSKSITLFDATFEFKYFWALILFVILYVISHVLIIVLDYLKEIYGEGRKIVKKMQEDYFNRSLERQNTNEQEKIKRYQIFVSTSIKKKFSHKECNVNLEEQNIIMNKFLISKTGINPTKFSDGFLYSFNDFNHIDEVLEYFFRLIKSDAPLDYIICVQIISENAAKEMEQLSQLINLKMVNKITTLSDTVWRYKFNKSHRYSTVQLGLFQHGKDTFEVHQFEEM